MSLVAAAAVMILVHKVLALLAMKYVWVGKIVKGIHRTLYHNGKMNDKDMRRMAVSKDDLIEAVRLEINEQTFENVDEIRIEKNGQVSVVKKTSGK